MLCGIPCPLGHVGEQIDWGLNPRASLLHAQTGEQAFAPTEFICLVAREEVVSCLSGQQAPGTQGGLLPRA